MCHVMNRLLYGCSGVVLYLYIGFEAEDSTECSKCSKSFHLSVSIILMISSVSIPKSWVWGPFLSLASPTCGKIEGLRINCSPKWQVCCWSVPWFILASAWLGDEIYVLGEASRAGESWVPQNFSLATTQLQNGETGNRPFPAFLITRRNPQQGLNSHFDHEKWPKWPSYHFLW